MEWMSQLFRPCINRGMQCLISPPPRHEHSLLSSSQAYVTVCTWFTDNKSINIVTFTHTNYLLIKELGVDAVDGVSYSGTQHSRILQIIEYPWQHSIPPPPTHTLSSSQVYITVCMYHYRVSMDSDIWDFFVGVGETEDIFMGMTRWREEKISCTNCSRGCKMNDK